MTRKQLLNRLESVLYAKRYAPRSRVAIVRIAATFPTPKLALAVRTFERLGS